MTDRLPPVPLCAACGVLAPTEASGCGACGAPLGRPRVTVEAEPDGTFWVAIRASFQCRSCQFLSPLDELDVDGAVECAQCGLGQRFDVDAWTPALRFAHGVGDLAFPRPEGRHPNPAVWIGDDNPYALVGVTETWAEHRQGSTSTLDGVVVHRSLFVEVAPGHPVCASCAVPARLEELGEGVVRSTCPGCGDAHEYTLPPTASSYSRSLVAVVADGHGDRPRARVARDSAGPVALNCPDCSGSLPATRERVVTCSFCGTASLIPAPARLRGGGEVLTPDTWWLAFRGVSARRAEVQDPPAQAPDDEPDKKALKKAKLTDLELAEEVGGLYLPQVLINLALPGAALVVALVLWWLVGDFIPAF